MSTSNPFTTSSCSNPRTTSFNQLHPAEASSPIIFDVSSSVEPCAFPTPPPPPPLPPPSNIPIGQINFVAQGQLEPAKFCVVGKDHPVHFLATKKFLEKFKLSQPEVLISITGSAFDFTLRSSKLEQIFDRGLLRAAQNTKAWIVTGGSDCGVMKRVGEAIRGDQHALVPCIGIASFNKISNNKLLCPLNTEPIKYSCDKKNDGQSAGLNPDHTHFILVRSTEDTWGQEIAFRTKYEDFISRKMKIPLVLVVVNGGPGTVETVVEGVTRKFPIIVVEGSGRASDAVAAYVKHCKDSRYKLDVWDQFKAEVWPSMTPECEQKLNRYLKKLRKHHEYITIFNLNENETEDMDKAILRCIFDSHGSCNFEHKLKLGVKWGRADLLEELFQKPDSPGDIKTQALSLALQESLKLDKPDIYELLVRKGAGLEQVRLCELYELAHNQIKRLAASAGLNVHRRRRFHRVTPGSSQVDLKTENSDVSNHMGNSVLDTSMKDLKNSTVSIRDSLTQSPTPIVKSSGVFSPEPTPIDQVKSSSSFLRKSIDIESFRRAKRAHEERGAIFNSPGKVRRDSDERTPLFNSTSSASSYANSAVSSPTQSPTPTSQNELENPQKILTKISPMYAKLLTDTTVTNTDILIWAILVDRFDLAKAVWRRTTYTIHSALVACHLYKVLGGWFIDEVYQQQYTWFESVAISVLTEMDYGQAVKVLNLEWEELDKNNALALAEYAKCKDFFATSHVQQILDDKFYSRSDNDVQLVPGTKIWHIFLMMLLPFTIPNYGVYFSIKRKEPPKLHHFYSLPIVKVLTSSVSYILFLMVLVCNLVMLDPDTRNPARFDIYWHEWLLWVWLFSSLVEEANQFSKDSKQHFSKISNRMDAVMYSLLLIYFILRLLAWYLRWQSLLLAYTDVLVIATIACFLRFMNVFALSKSLGPLFFVIIRLLNDVGQWLFIFLLFMISFQVGIFAFTRQVGESGWTFFPHGSMGTGFTAILGDLGDNTMEWMTRTRFGVIVVLVYSLVTQVMLVNLLIAMMGNTYTVVKDNADKEWKFYHYTLVTDYSASSTCPSPFNIIYLIYHHIRSFGGPRAVSNEPDQATTPPEREKLAVEKILKTATERIIEQEKANVKYALPSISGSIHEQIRLLSTQRDSDRLYLEQRMSLATNTLAEKFSNLDRRIQSSEENFSKLNDRLEKLETMDKNLQAILAILQSPNRN